MGYARWRADAMRKSRIEDRRKEAERGLRPLIWAHDGFHHDRFRHEGEYDFWLGVADEFAWNFGGFCIWSFNDGIAGAIEFAGPTESGGPSDWDL
jgi:hypothetical protein